MALRIIAAILSPMHAHMPLIVTLAAALGLSLVFGRWWATCWPAS
jgi:hypothetical protein